MSALRLAFILEVVDRATAVVSRVDKAVDRMTGPVKRVHAQWQAMARDPQVTHAMGRLLQTAQPIAMWSLAAVGALTAVAGAAGAAMLSLTGVVDRVSSVADTAIKLGMTTEKFSQWGFAARQSGSNAEAMSTGLLHLSDKLVEARTGSKEAQLWLSRVGITMADVNKGITAGTAFERLADTFERVGDVGNNAAKKIAVMKALMGRGGTDLIQLANGGSAGLRQLEKTADDLGITLDTKTGAGMKAFGDKLAGLHEMSAAVWVRVAAAALPAMTKVVDKLTAMRQARGSAWADQLGESLGRLIELLPRVLTGLADFSVWVTGAAARVDSMVQKIGGWNTVLQVLAGLVGVKVLLALVQLGGAVVGLGLALWATPFGAFALGVAGLAALATAVYVAWEPIKAFFAGLWDDIVAGLNKLDALMPKWLPRLPDVAPGGELIPPAGADAAPSAVGSAGAAAPSAIGARGAPYRAEVGGTLKIEFDDAGKPRVRELRKAPGSVLDLDVYFGKAMAGS